jgi:hypothetical protein
MLEDVSIVSGVELHRNPRSPGHASTGALVLWCFGALVLWCFGALGFWMALTIHHYRRT